MKERKTDARMQREMERRNENGTKELKKTECDEKVNKAIENEKNKK